MQHIAATVARRRVEMSIDGDQLTVGRRSFTMLRELTIPVLIGQGRAPIAAQLIAGGAPSMLASAISLMGWTAAAWDVLERGEFELAARWRMGREQ